MTAVLWPSMMRRLADDVGAAAEAALPERVAQDDRRLGAAEILGRRVEPAEQGLHAQRLKGGRRDAMAGETLGGKTARVIREVDLSCEVVDADRVERLGVIPQHEEHRRRERAEVARDCPAVVM